VREPLTLIAIHRFRREASVALAILGLAIVLAAAAPGYFSRANLSDLFLANLPVLVVSLGATLVILTAEIDISVGSVFAICGVLAGVSARAGLPMPGVVLVAVLAGAALGALNGSLVAYLSLPSIVVTLATMVALRDGLRWITQGAWVQNLPAGFQWFGMSQQAYPIAGFTIAAALLAAIAWMGANMAAGRAVYATGSNPDAARLAGLDTAFVKFAVFTAAGALTGLAALLNSVRFNQIPSNAGLGLELKVIAAVVVGGASIRGGRGTFAGTLLGVLLLGAIGPALTFIGINAYWERAIQGAIILAAVAADARRDRPALRAAALPAGGTA
jgi:rhamnose transport system permease protein